MPFPSARSRAPALARALRAALALELFKMREQRALGPAPQLSRRVRVDRWNDLAERARLGRERRCDLGLALEAVANERADPPRRGTRWRAVRGKQRGGLERRAALERCEVRGHVAVRRVDHDGPAARQQVAAEERAAPGVPERDRVARV